MTRWTVTAKRVERVDALSQRLILVCERAGCIRFEAVVTGKTFDEKQVGDEVELNTDGGRR